MTEVLLVELPEPIRLVCAGQDFLFAVSYTSNVYMWKPYDPSWYILLPGLFNSLEESKGKTDNKQLSEEEKFKQAV